MFVINKKTAMHGIVAGIIAAMSTHIGIGSADNTLIALVGGFIALIVIFQGLQTEDERYSALLFFSVPVMVGILFILH